MQIDYPKSRMDNFFAKAAGSDLADDSMEPQTDREYWINAMAAKIAEGGSGGGGGGGLVVNIADDALDKTAGEIMEAAQAGAAIWLYDDSVTEYSQVYAVKYSSSFFQLMASTTTGMPNYFEASSLDDYPIRGEY